MTNNFNFKDYSNQLLKALDLVNQNQVDNFFDVFDSYFSTKANIYLLGNGGSQEKAHHISGDLMKKFSLNVQELAQDGKDRILI